MKKRLFLTGVIGPGLAFVLILAGCPTDAGGGKLGTCGYGEFLYGGRSNHRDQCRRYRSGDGTIPRH